MTIYLTAALVLFVTLLRPVNLSFSALPEDLEGSGDALESSGSGSGDWSEQGEIKNMEDPTNSKDVRILGANSGGGTRNTSHGAESSLWPTGDGRSEFVVVSTSKSFMENTDLFAAVIAGGVTGVTLAAALAAILIYKWKNKDDGGYILGQQRSSGKE